MSNFARSLLTALKELKVGVRPATVMHQRAKAYPDEELEKNTLVAVQGAGGLSSPPKDLEGKNAQAWGRNIWADALL